MKTMLDTHVLLWLLFDEEKLSPKAVDALMCSRCCVSVASFWEMSVKMSTGMLRLPKSLEEIAQQCALMGIDIAPITLEDCMIVRALPFIHRDPFDRIIIAHAIAEDMPLVTHDSNVRRYPQAQVIW